MQFLHKTDLSAAEYVSAQAWWEATPPPCPFHPDGGCELVPHGSYGRVEPPGMRVRRFRCPAGKGTVSMLPQFLAACLMGTLEEVEQVLREVERAQPGEPCWRELHPAKHYNGRAKVWAQRRIAAVVQLLCVLPTLLPKLFGGWPGRWASFDRRAEASGGGLLVSLRLQAEWKLSVLPAPVGFRRGAAREPPEKAENEGPGGAQHGMERAPPAGTR